MISETASAYEFLASWLRLGFPWAPRARQPEDHCFRLETAV